MNAVYQTVIHHDTPLPANMRPPIGGRIRPGIRVLTKAASTNANAVRIYETGVAAGLSFDEIELAIKKAEPRLTNPLVMRNVSWFTVRAADFPNPRVAQSIMDLYGTDKGDGNGRRLYRFPAIFTSDRLSDVMASPLRCYTATELKYWSEFGEDKTLRCMMRQAPPKNADGSISRIYGGRTIVPRPDNGGLCNPQKCAEFQSKQCNTCGEFRFHIPGINTLLPLAMPFGSHYAVLDAASTFRHVSHMRGGRISGWLTKDQSFWFTKAHKEVSYIERETGLPKKVKHWIISLDADIDPTELLRLRDDAQAAQTAAAAAALLQGTAPASAAASAPVAPAFATAVDTASMDEPDQADGIDASSAPVTCEEPSVTGAGDGAPATDAPALPVPPSVPVVQSALVLNAAAPVAADATADRGVADLHALVTELGIELDAFHQFARRKWGAGWSLNPRGVARVLAFLNASRGELESLQAQIKAAATGGA